ncbi:MAG: hypothetical protein HC929_16200 [Leptolyngbyaceae cyanobacterium SM2_5_2]|nr:hypothetical protein [Leptolyngbyaceae cyanobacterium SM2_5_2]
MSDHISLWLRCRRPPPTLADYLPLAQYCADHFISYSQGRRLIRKRRVVAVKLRGRWYVKK